MPVIGSATLNIVPKVQGGLANSINGEIRKANLTASGKAAGASFMGGLTSGAAFGLWSNVASRAIDAVTGSLGSAASRVDTLNNYPKIMESLGVSGDAAKASMDKMSTSLDNVPTRLDDMANTVQGIYAATMKYGTGLDTVTDAGLALNSMLLAGGQNQQIVNSAMEQFRQMVAKGKPDLQDWRALISAAPGQMDQLAKAMLGPTAAADDLYAALGGGKEADYTGAFEWGSISMGEFVERFAGLRDEFEGAAQDAQNGIGTAFANMQNAVTKGVANVLDAFGQERIASAIGDVKGAINGIFGTDDTQGLRAFATEVAPMVSAAWDDMVGKIDGFSERVAPSLGTVSEILVGAMRDVGPAISTIAGSVLEAASEIAPGVSVAVGDAIKAVSDAAGDAAPAVADLAGSLVRGAGAAVKGVAGIVKDAAPVVSSIAQSVLPVMGNIVEAIGPVLPMILTAKTALGGFGTVAGLLSGAGTSALGFAGSLGKVAGAIGAVAKPAAEILPMVRKVSDIGPALTLVTEASGGLSGALAPVGAAAGEAAAASGGLLAAINPMGVAAGVAAAGVGLLAVGLVDAWQKEQKAQRRSEELGGAISGMQANTEGLSAALRIGSQDVDGLGSAFRDAKPDVDGLVDSLAQHSQRNAETRQSTSDMIDELDRYKGVIDGAIGAGDDYEGSMAELQAAIDGLNGILGTSYDKHDVLKGKYKDEAGEIHNLRDEIDQLVAARKREAYTSALQEMYSDTLKEQMSAQRELTKAEGQYDKAHRDFMESTRDMINPLTNLKYTQEELERAFRNSEGGKQAARDLHEARRACSALNDELSTYDQMLNDANGWGEREGVIMTTQKMREACEQAGFGVKELSQGLLDAGVSAEQLAQVGGDQFSIMAEMAGGSMDTLIGLIQDYNAQEFQDKYGYLHVDGYGNIVDAEGKIYEWNGTEMVPKYAELNADDAIARAGEVNEQLSSIEGDTASATATVSTSGQAELDTLQSSLQRNNGFAGTSTFTNHTYGKAALDDMLGTARSANGSSWSSTFTMTTRHITENITINTTKNGPKATGAHIEPHHASGFLAVGPTHTNYGLVGEDGVEAVYNNDDGSSDVYPLNNPRYLGYADPLAERIADAIADKGGVGGGGVSVYIDGAKVNDDPAIRSAFLNFFDVLQRKGAMNVG